LLELKQAKIKCEYDFKEIKNDYTTKIEYLESLSKKLKNQRDDLLKIIHSLEDEIFNSEKYKEKEIELQKKQEEILSNTKDQL